MTTAEQPITHLTTLQFAWGGLFDATPVDDLVHLVRGTERGTPGPTLCGIDRFAPDAPGWSVGGGVTGPGMVHTPCSSCVETARRDFPGLMVTGMKALSAPLAVALGEA
ncbi:hypothetical protein [Amycolatopsis thermophila]|uniref:Uncharacterized protein n=1 Tax=Amycolatopsis thermophila TaxID=206084 RepID=A0ABU0EN20_9PSEU|nr:hypothetical protein [Amycolatopsis thermophila]MDQ0376569.1 hypothetical protein [Amycolatopsis thermophila]